MAYHGPACRQYSVTWAASSVKLELEIGVDKQNKLVESDQTSA